MRGEVRTGHNDKGKAHMCLEQLGRASALTVWTGRREEVFPEVVSVFSASVSSLAVSRRAGSLHFLCAYVIPSPPHPFWLQGDHQPHAELGILWTCSRETTERKINHVDGAPT